jgi:PAS domain S-box-containing protein
MALAKATEPMGGNEQFLARVLEAMPLALFGKDPGDQFRYVLFNPKAEEVFGLGRDQVLHRTDYEIFPEAQADAYWEADLRALWQGGTVETPEQIAGGIHLHTLKTTIRDEEGRPHLVLGITEDITGRKRMETELKHSRESLAKAQALAEIGNWDWELATGEVRWSDQMFRILGLEPGVQVPSLRTIMARTHPEDRPAFGRAMRRLMARPGSSTPSWRGTADPTARPCACGAPSRTSPSGATPRMLSARRRSWRAWGSWRGASPTTSTTCCPPSAATWNWPRCTCATSRRPRPSSSRSRRS